MDEEHMDKNNDFEEFRLNHELAAKRSCKTFQYILIINQHWVNLIRKSNSCKTLKIKQRKKLKS